MTDPNAYVADQIGQQAASVQGQPVDQATLAQTAAAQAGSGVTEADINAIMAQLANVQAQLDAQAAAAKKAAPDALTSSVNALKTYAERHSDSTLMPLIADAGEAALNAKPGNTDALANIVDKIVAHLKRHPAGPGDQTHYNNLLDTAQYHIPDVIDTVNASAPAGTALASSQPPAKVVAGSVVG